MLTPFSRTELLFGKEAMQVLANSRVVVFGIGGIPIISSMGAGNKLNPAGFEVADIYETSVCPLAK